MGDSEACEAVGEGLELGGEGAFGVGPDGEKSGVVDFLEGAEVFLPVEHAGGEAEASGVEGEGGGGAEVGGGGGVSGVGVGDERAEGSGGLDRVVAHAEEEAGVEAGGEAGLVEGVEEGAEVGAGFGAGFEGQADASVIGAAAEFVQGVGEQGAARGVGLGGNGSDAGEDERRAEVEGEGEGGIGLGQAVVELVVGVEGAADGEAQGGERNLNRAQSVAEVAAAGVGKSRGVEVAGGVEDDPPGPESGGLAKLVLDGLVGVGEQANAERRADHGVVSRIERNWREGRLLV